MLYDAPPAVGPDHPVTGPGDAPHLLDVELLEAPAVVGHDPHPLVRHLAAPLHRQLLQVGAVLGQQLQPSVSHLCDEHIAARHNVVRKVLAVFQGVLNAAAHTDVLCDGVGV